MRFSQFRRAIESAAQLDVLEGLPHPAVEPHAFARESAANAERDILGSRFYQESHPLDAEDHAAIRTVLAERRTFVRRYPDLRFWLTVRSLCGGFHADFAIEFRHDGRVGAALVCFGCREIKTLIQGRHWHHDLLPDAEAVLSRILRRYHRHKRPVPTPPPRRAGISRAEALEAVGAILTDLDDEALSR